MDFTFTDEQRMIAASCRDLLTDLLPAAELHAVAEGAGALSNAHWARLAEFGLTGMLAPASFGGMGLSDVDFVLIAEEAGRALLPEPLVEHAGVAVPLLTSFAADSRVNEWLTRAANGAARVAVGAACNPFVLGADRADALLLAHDDEVHLVERGRFELIEQSSIDPLRTLSRVAWSPSAATCIAAGEAGGAIWTRATARGAVYTAAQCAGLAERMVEMSVAYASERTQFGKRIGSYQALKHQLANVQVKLQFARALIYSAVVRAADNDSRAAIAVSSAKLAAADVADLAARTSLQIHGAMGYSWELDLHFYMKRAWALLGAWGDRSFHARRVQSLLFGGSLPLGPGQTFMRTES